jgi:hypothetical protein
MGRTKKPELEAKRGRRSNTEILRISASAMREMRDLASESRMPLAQVHADVISIGLCEVRRILYDQIITARNEIESRLNVKVEQTVGNGGPGRSSEGSGDRSDGSGSVEPAGERTSATDSPGDFERSADVVEQPGFGAEDAENAVVDAGQVGVSGGDGPG